MGMGGLDDMVGADSRGIRIDIVDSAWKKGMRIWERS